MPRKREEKSVFSLLSIRSSRSSSSQWDDLVRSSVTDEDDEDEDEDEDEVDR